MSGERKKAVLKPVTKLEPKKRVPLPEKVVEEKPVVVPVVKEKVVKKEVVKKVVAVKKEEPIVVEEEPKEVKQRAKPSENKYIRLVTDANAEERKEVSDKVKNGEVKWAFYGTEGDKGYHYYLVFKK
jgi:hypothetical protein